MRTMVLKNLRRFRSVILPLALFAFLNSCFKGNQMDWIYYDETNCADRWEFTNNNELLKDRIVAYYKGKGVRIYEIEIFSDRTREACSECICKTGRRVKAKIKHKDAKVMKAEGFYEQ
jgi:hypothetical protein